ncbi:MAG: four helix bundle protein [Candidatus Blackburnbacteria bacterium RIFCSPHIGHO2_02_FULL_39_13]|nr:MAG: four helix bundle protein [Candidatus Blackburnbacteria bacterium RIFCSPHIGHO2_01_FULL_40_17]OGY09318.1 MAG: four helix bundle protein [Candidatus Blackburnbacteria bacterium RIFCSPHIGHO2_02_FULL_39_13]
MNKQFTNFQKEYNLEERTVVLAENIIHLVKKVKVTPINTRIIEQVVGSGGSVGANYCEANEAESKKDFTHKVGICKKEIKETKHWLRLLAASNPETREETRTLWKESQELLLIFSSIVRSSRLSSNTNSK